MRALPRLTPADVPYVLETRSASPARPPRARNDSRTGATPRSRGLLSGGVLININHARDCLVARSAMRSRRSRDPGKQLSRPGAVHNAAKFGISTCRHPGVPPVPLIRVRETCSAGLTREEIRFAACVAPPACPPSAGPSAETFR